MPAPAIVLDPPPPVQQTWTMQPVELRGFRITGSITQTGTEGDWTIAASTTMFDQTVVAPNDQTFSNNKSRITPWNEAPSLAAATAVLQAFVDEIHDAVPTP